MSHLGADDGILRPTLLTPLLRRGCFGCLRKQRVVESVQASNKSSNVSFVESFRSALSKAQIFTSDLAFV